MVTRALPPPPLLPPLLLLLAQQLCSSCVHARHCCYTADDNQDCCYADSNKARVLAFPGRAPPHQASLTREGCMHYCAGKGFVLAGVEAGKQCFCGNSTAASAQRADPEACGAPCSGNRSETCGADYFVDLMSLSCSGPPDPPPSPLPPPPPPPGPRPPFKQGLKNVLFIGSDDMRAELGTYGSAHMHTPNLDRLGASGTVFERAYIAVSVCMPSRTALLTSRRPDTTRNYELRGAAEYHRNVVNATTIPQFFKESGFVTYGCGKLFHYLPDGEIAYSWDDTSPSGLCTASGGWSPRYFNPNSGSPSGNLDSCLDNVTDDELSTGEMTVGTMRTLDWIVEARKNGTLEAARPFFVGVGYHRPHEPYVSPRKYCDLYPDPDTTNTSFRLPPHVMPPLGMPDVAWSISGYFKGHGDIKAAYNSTYHNATLVEACRDPNPATANVTLQLSEQCLIPLWKTARMRVAYWAAISYVDAMVGRLLDKLDALQLTDSTVVIFWGDHVRRRPPPPPARRQMRLRKTCAENELNDRARVDTRASDTTIRTSCRAGLPAGRLRVLGKVRIVPTCRVQRNSVPAAWPRLESRHERTRASPPPPPPCPGADTWHALLPQIHELRNGLGSRIWGQKIEIGRIRTGCLVLAENIQYLYTPF